jgi:hypothetical protein
MGLDSHAESFRFTLRPLGEFRVGIPLRAPGEEGLKDNIDRRRLSLRISWQEQNPDFRCLKQIPVDSLDLSRWCLYQVPAHARAPEQEQR